MESSNLTDMTIKLYKDLKSISNNIGIVFQAYLHRTEDDILKLYEKSNIRLCKGSYKESEDIAYQDYHDINKNYIKVLKTVFRKGIYVGIATHDKSLIEKCIKILSNEHIKKLYVIGVSSIYDGFFKYADELHITQINNIYLF